METRVIGYTHGGNPPGTLSTADRSPDAVHSRGGVPACMAVGDWSAMLKLLAAHEYPNNG